MRQIAGSGTLGISIASGTAVDAIGNAALASAASTTFIVDPTTPGISIDAPSTSRTRSGPVTFTVYYSNVEEIGLTTSDIVLNHTGTATGSITKSHFPTRPHGSANGTITISNIAGDGTLGISINSGTATAIDTENGIGGAGPSATLIVDNTPPIITLLGGDPTVINVGSTYTDSGVIALDAVDGDLSESVSMTSNVDASKVGAYEVEYSVTDSLGNTAHKFRTVNVVRQGESVPVPVQWWPLPILFVAFGVRTMRSKKRSTGN